MILRPLLAAFLLCCFIALARAQGVVCPQTPAVGTSNTQCANTAFVQKQLATSLAGQRTPLTTNTTYYIRTDGSNSVCNGTANASSASAPNCAWADANFAIGFVQTNIDLKQFPVSLVYGEATSNWTLISSIVCYGPFVGDNGAGGPLVTLQGSATWTTTGTIINGTTNNVIAIDIENGCHLAINQLQIASSVYSAIAIGTGTYVTFGNILWEGGVSAVADTYQTRDARVEQVAHDIIKYISTPSYHQQSTHGGEIRNAGQTTTFGANAAYGQSYVDAEQLGRIVYTASPTINTNGNTVTGTRCSSAWGGLIEEAGLGATFFPGNSACVINNTAGQVGFWED